MATTTNLLSWEAFEQLPDDGMHHEILEGELITLPPPKFGHGDVAWRTANALRILQDRRIGRVYTEMGYKLSERPPTWIQPDVSFVHEERCLTARRDGYFIGSPELAVEVVSPSETLAGMDRKVKTLLAAGGAAVWVIDPETLSVHVFLRDGISFTRGIGDALSL